MPTLIIRHTAGPVLFAALAWVLVGSYSAPAQDPAVFTPPPLPDSGGKPVAPLLPGAAPIGTAPPKVASRSPVVQPEPVTGGRIIARIDGELVLEGDLLWQANQLIRANAAKIQVPASQLDNLRSQLIQFRLLPGIIDTKLLTAELRKVVPAEKLEEIRGQLAGNFEKQVVPLLKEEYEVETRAQLEVRLRDDQSSLKQQQEAFIEQELAKVWLQQQINYEPEILPDEIRDDYQSRLSEYEYPAQVRWEELAVRIDRFDGQADAAYREIAEMGNEVYYHEQGQGGRPWAEVARSRSQGFTADKGGVYEWTTKGSLASDKIDKALFTLPVGSRSEIIRSKIGWHIVRVIERKEAGRTPFEEAQEDIRSKLKRKNIQRQIAEYLTELRSEKKIWSVYTGDTTVASYQEAVRR